MAIKDRITHAWNAFLYKNPYAYDRGHTTSRPAHKFVNHVSRSSYVSTIFNRIAMDVSMTKFKHVKVDPKNEDETPVNSGLNNCLNVEANIDQSHIQFIHDLVYSMFDEGVVAAVPIDTDIDPESSNSYDILSMRVGRIINWMPEHVEIEVYNDRTGQNERKIFRKNKVAIIENPLYAVVNSENSTLKRLIRKLNQIDNIDELTEASRLDLLITLPGKISTTAQKKLAEERISNIEHQLSTGKYGVAYIDGAEKAIQLNRPINNQLYETIDKLSTELYNQLGLTENILNGTASESELRNYYGRAIDPIVNHFTAEFIRKFLSKTARTQGQTIEYYRDMFKMVPVEVIATLSDTLRRNYVASSNELRKIIGLKRSNDPRADELFNPNIADNKQMQNPGVSPKSLIEKSRLAEENAKQKKEKLGSTASPE